MFLYWAIFWVLRLKTAKNKINPFYLYIQNPHLPGSVFYVKMKHMKQMILLMGGQGVGKGTFARMLNNHNKYKIIETGKMLRDAATTDKTIADIMARGELLPFETLVHLIEKNIDTDHDLLLDGFPRTMDQAKWLVDNYADKFNIHVLYLHVPESVMIARIQKRIREGGGRADDADTSAVRKRLDTFWHTTMPAIEWLATVPNIKFSDVDVTGNVDKNFQNILQALKQ